MQDAIIEKVSSSQLRKHPKFQVGDRLNVFVRLKEGEKERVQAFRGIVISKHPKSGKGASAMFTVRKISEGVGVERIFPFHSPFIDKIEVESSAKVRRSRLYYLRALRGRKARLKSAETFADLVAPEVAPVVGEVASDAAAPTEVTTDKK